jgi:acylphosphatase
MEQLRAHVTIEGRVQGVSFRAAAREQARSMGVAGWVRNLDDGRVEAIFEGSAAAVRQMISWCHHGPQFAHVDRVDVEWAEPTGHERGFRIA